MAERIGLARSKAASVPPTIHAVDRSDRKQVFGLGWHQFTGACLCHHRRGMRAVVVRGRLPLFVCHV